MKSQLSITNTLITFLLLITMSCNQKQKESRDHIRPESTFPYRLQYYSNKYKLPGFLEEISGISYLGNNLLACIQDEKGLVYIYSLAEEKVTQDIRFADNGDFEDIAVVGNAAYVLRSDGVLFQIDDFDGSNRVTKLETPLTSRNDTEGLCFHSESNSLWIACKAQSGIGKHVSGFRAAYSYSLGSQRLSEKPIIAIDLAYLEELAEQRLSFEPSGIAIHPITGHTYMISSVGKVLIVLDSQNEIIHLQSLSHKGFKQPEGICFAENGDLFISNEGRGGKGNVLRFEYIQ
ncbi:MAG: SdiA-regulated domain-containing protein [Flammeovirgaceae bacterium]